MSDWLTRLDSSCHQHQYLATIIARMENWKENAGFATSAGLPRLPTLSRLTGLPGLPRSPKVPEDAYDSIQKGIICSYGFTDRISRPKKPKFLAQLECFGYANQ